jgi:hypothetical protein
MVIRQLMPAVLTCVVGKKLCQDPSCDNHHRLRDRAARAVAHICRRYFYTEFFDKPAFTLFFDNEQSINVSSLTFQ